MIQKFLSLFLLLQLTGILVLAPPPGMADETGISTSAKQAIVIDYETGMSLMEKNADQQMPTSSMSKVMTMYTVFDALKNGELGLDDELLVSEKAWRKGGSKMFVEVDKYVEVEDLIRGVIVQSGNDATIVLAEGLAGSESAFAELMTGMAHDLGMDNSQFTNASGWPDPDHYSTARDLATLARTLVRDFPEFYDYYSEQEFTYNKITQKNRNPLLYRNIGADGIKTGHTQAGGYGLIGSGVHNGRRVILVLNGLDSSKDRAREAAKLLEWGLKRFENKTLLAAGDQISAAPVVLGSEGEVPLVVDRDVRVTIPKLVNNNYTLEVEYKSPVKAPVEKGGELGVLRVKIPNMEEQIYPLYAGIPVAEQNVFGRTFAKARLFFSQNLGRVAP